MKLKECIKMTERERLNELLKSGEYINEQFSERLADFLLENGVIFPRAKVNQSIWTDDQFVDGIPHEGHVTSIKITNDYNAYYCSFDEFPVSFAFVDDDIGKTIFFTREEAEKALEKLDSKEV